MEPSLLDHIMAFIVNYRFSLFLLGAFALAAYVIYLEACHYMLKWRNEYLEKDITNKLIINAELTKQNDAKEDKIENLEVAYHELVQQIPAYMEW